MTEIASIEDIKQSYTEGASVAPSRYERKVKKAKWKDKAVSQEAQDLYEQKMSDSSILKRRQKKLEGVSEEEWRNMALTKGKARIGEGMKSAVDKQARGFAPYREVIANTSLPPRTADGMTNLTQRAGAIVQALEAKKKELLG